RSWSVIYLLNIAGRQIYLGLSEFSAMQAISARSAGFAWIAGVLSARPATNSKTIDSGWFLTPSNGPAIVVIAKVTPFQLSPRFSQQHGTILENSRILP